MLLQPPQRLFERIKLILVSSDFDIPLFLETIVKVEIIKAANKHKQSDNKNNFFIFSSCDYYKTYLIILQIFIYFRMAGR